ncbi:hypothetical protein AAY473_004007 [Plecturocebus cupreus]
MARAKAAGSSTRVPKQETESCSVTRLECSGTISAHYNLHLPDGWGRVTAPPSEVDMYEAKCHRTFSGEVIAQPREEEHVVRSPPWLHSQHQD